MAEKSLYVLAGYDDETEAKLAGMQQHLYELGFSGTQTKDIPMHFTLGQFDTSGEQKLKDRLSALSGSMGAFEVDFSNLGLFENPEREVLFVRPKISVEMLELQDHFSDRIDQFPWLPHTTLLIDKPEVIEEARKVVLEEFRAFSGKVTTLYLYEFWPTRHVLTVQLKRK
jgi:2'-5' RNA ligase